MWPLGLDTGRDGGVALAPPGALGDVDRDDRLAVDVEEVFARHGGVLYRARASVGLWDEALGGEPQREEGQVRGGAVVPAVGEPRVLVVDLGGE